MTLKACLNKMVFICTVFSFSSHTLAIEPAPINVGGVEVAPTLKLLHKYDDNIFSQDSDEVDSWVTTITPTIQAKADNGQGSYTMLYQLDGGVYSNSSDDNFLDHRFGLDGEWELNHRNTIGANFELNNLHEERGTGFSQGGNALNLSSPDEYRETVLSGDYTLGGIKSKGRLISEFEYYDKRYTNHRATTNTRDRDQIKIKETFLWSLTGKTELLIEGSYTDIDYKNDPASLPNAQDTLDSSRLKLLTGVNWKATGKTEGEIKFGYANKSFDDSDRDDFNGLSWDVKIQWAPKEYSKLTFNSGTSQEEANGSGDFIDTSKVGLAWNHEWNDRFNTGLNFSYTKEDYEGDINNQEDDSYVYGIRLNYEMRRWLSLGSSFRFEERSSNVEDQDYKRNIIALHIEASL